MLILKVSIQKKNWSPARAGNVIGGGDWSPNRFIPDTINSLLKNKQIVIRNPKFNRPWQHVLEPLNGYLILGYKLYKNPDVYSEAWNFGSKKNTIKSVSQVVKKIIEIWGSGEVLFKRNKIYYEQENLQLNIKKAQTKLKWCPKYTINESIKITTDWYKAVHLDKIPAIDITSKQILNFFDVK